MRKIRWSTVFALLAILALVLPVSANGENFPEVIQLPVGFRPEGIEIGHGSTFFVGSLVDGSIYRGDLRTGEGEVFIEGETGMVAVGLDYDERSNYLFVAGGATGFARVYDAENGELIEEYELAPGNFINDVIVTCEAAYFTNSNDDVLYRIPLGPGGEPADPSEVETIQLSGDWTQVEGFNANGIEASPNGEWLIVVNSTVGNLYRVDPDTGEATLIDLGGASVTNGDGLLLRGGLLYVLRNRLNLIAVFDLADHFTTGELVEEITDSDFAVPTTLEAFGNALYAVNAKFGAPNPEAIPYEVVRVELN